MARNIDVFFYIRASFMMESHLWRCGKKIYAPKRVFLEAFSNINFVFCAHLHKCDSISKICMRLEKTSMFRDNKIQNVLNIFSIFSNFNVHPRSCELELTIALTLHTHTQNVYSRIFVTMFGYDQTFILFATTSAQM